MTDPIDLSPNARRFTAFADLYDRVRPSPPAVLAALLCRYAHQAGDCFAPHIRCTASYTPWSWEISMTLPSGSVSAQM